MEYKFKVGERVKAIKSGRGIHTNEIGKVVTITGLGNYDGGPGYFVNPPIGNSRTGNFNGFIGEISFESAEPFILISRAALAEIYDGVCDSWQARIRKILSEDLFSDNVIVSISLIKDAYVNANSSLQTEWLRKYCPIQAEQEVEVKRIGVIRASDGKYIDSFPDMLDFQKSTYADKPVFLTVELEGKYTIKKPL